MRRFRVMLQGAPVLLLDVDSQEVNRLGFYTTRWIQAESAEEAGRLASRMVLDELMKTGTKNPPEHPIHVAVDEVVEASWFEMLRRAPGRGFTFYPDDSN
jgi:hypothetical protein